MKLSYRRYLHRISPHLNRALLLATACAALLVYTTDTRADDPARVRDRVYGDIQVLFWSEAIWTQNGGNIGCTTFAGGTWTGPGNTFRADSVVCDPTPTDWHWTVTLPNGSILMWGVDNLPVGVEACAQIFYSRDHPYLLGKADLGEDYLVIADGHLNEVLYSGPLSTFDPEGEGFIPTEGRRCGVILPLPAGACCFPDGHCEVTFEDACAEEGGTYQGENTVCDPNPCPPPPEACCFPDGHCEFVTAEVCRQLGGVPQGSGSVCDPNPCPPPPGACCFPDGHCEFVTAEVCRQLGGVPQGYGSVCDPNPCPPPPEACCFPDCHCELLTAIDCVNLGGNPMGPGVTCDPNPCDCPPPTGACCIGDQGDCRILTLDECLQQGGMYQGDGTTCEPVNPCPIVPTENTTWGRIKSAYR
jgi:hypothetical protein